MASDVKLMKTEQGRRAAAEALQAGFKAIVGSLIQSDSGEPPAIVIIITDGSASTSGSNSKDHVQILIDEVAALFRSNQRTGEMEAAAPEGESHGAN